MKPSLSVRVRPTTPDDFEAIQDLCRRVYPTVPPWGPEQLASHIRVFPEGQFTAEEVSSGRWACCAFAPAPAYATTIAMPMR